MFTGQPLRYKLSDDGKTYSIYSVASNGADDNGKPASMIGPWMLWQDQPDTDWVWNSDAADQPTPRKKKQRK